MKPLVYIETTIPSYYCDSRPDLSADIARTHEWWEQERAEYECYVSPLVVAELSIGDYPTRAACLALIQGLPLVALNQEVQDIAAVYQTRHLMPKMPSLDAVHVALASYYSMDFLLTWNCRHLANANKFRHLEQINAQLGLKVPRLVTPDQLRPVEDYS